MLFLADIILDQAGQRFVVRRRNALLQPFLIRLWQKTRVNIEDHLRRIAAIPKNGKATIIAAQQITGWAGDRLRLRFFFDGRRSGTGGLPGIGGRLRLRRGSAAGEECQTSPSSRAAMAIVRDRMIRRGMGKTSFSFFRR